MGLLLDLSPRNLERVLYFSHYIITSIDEPARQEAIKQLEENYSQEIAKRQESLDAKIKGTEQATVEEVNQLRRNGIEEEPQLREKLAAEIEQLKGLHQSALLTENQYNELQAKTN